MFYLRTPDVTLVGSSPEIMVRVVDGKVTVRPLAGTRRRGATDEEDRATGRRTAGRSQGTGRARDAGRPGPQRRRPRGEVSASVELTDVMVIERYSHVMHITSNVTGQLADDRDAFDALASLLAGRHGFRRAEGAGDADHRRARTAPPRAVRRRGRLRRFQRQHGYLHRPADAGDCTTARPTCKPAPASWPTASRRSEYQETLNKARGLLKAIEITQQRSSVASIGMHCGGVAHKLLLSRDLVAH